MLPEVESDEYAIDDGPSRDCHGCPMGFYEWEAPHPTKTERRCRVDKYSRLSAAMQYQEYYNINIATVEDTQVHVTIKTTFDKTLFDMFAAAEDSDDDIVNEKVDDKFVNDIFNLIRKRWDD